MKRRREGKKDEKELKQYYNKNIITIKERILCKLFTARPGSQYLACDATGSLHVFGRMLQCILSQE